MAQKKSKTPTIREIAAQAGVSICTVSRVLNKSDLVKRQTIEKVQRVIEELEQFNLT